MAKKNEIDNPNKGLSKKDSDAKDLDKKIIDQIRESDIPNKDKDHIIAAMEMYSGPIPHPRILEGYQKLYPKAAERIIENGIAESEHRRQMETARQKRRGRMAWVSLIGSILLAIILLIGGIVLALYNHKVLGPVSMIGGILTVIGSLGSNSTELSENDDLTNSKDHNTKK